MAIKKSLPTIEVVEICTKDMKTKTLKYKYKVVKLVNTLIYRMGTVLTTKEIEKHLYHGTVIDVEIEIIIHSENPYPKQRFERTTGPL